MAKDENFLTVAEYARRHDCTIGYVYQLVWAGRLAARKVDGVWRITTSASEVSRTQRAASRESSVVHATA